MIFFVKLNVFTVTFDQFSAQVLIYLFLKKKNSLTQALER